MDDVTFEVLEKLKLSNVSLIKISEFEDQELQRIKPSRTVAEYCWTCTPSLPLYILKHNPTLATIAYLDADLYFYSSPQPIYDEFGKQSIMIIEHRFPPHLKHLEVNGIYNVEMLIFANNNWALECLQWWRDRCIEWCYYRLEDGKLGDQKYLDDWPSRFNEVHVLQHKGAGVALWNVNNYSIRKHGHTVFIDDDPLIFYHFHQFTLLRFGEYDFGDRGHYVLLPEMIEQIYRPYIKAIEEATVQVRSVDKMFNHGYRLVRPGSYLQKMLHLPQRLMSLFVDK